MYVRDGYAEVARLTTIHISDLPPALGIPLFECIQGELLSAESWTEIYFALMVMPEGSPVFPWGKQITLEHVEQLLRRVAATIRADHEARELQSSHAS